MSPASQPNENPLAGRDMVWVPGGRFTMGSENHYPEERPTRYVRVDGFWMDRAPVTNAEFKTFVDATGYRTVAEQPPNAADYPGALEAALIPASLVFDPPDAPIDPRGPATQWWSFVPGANWRRPTGPGSTIEGCFDHPVVHVALEDVDAYNSWAGVLLPTEAEWEFAAHGGLEGAEYAWGNTLVPEGVHHANLWQGAFPHANSLEDGWLRTSPIGSFPANGYGLYDLIGNVWEWTADWWALPSAAPSHSCCAIANPRSTSSQLSIAMNDPAAIPRRVLKGGSHLCAPSYCRRYRPAARHAHPIDTSTSHIGFRCIVRPNSVS